MRRIVIQEPNHIHPFNEPARDLRIQNVPLWLWQRDIFGPHFREEGEFRSLEEARIRVGDVKTATLVHKDNLFFNKSLIDEFVSRAVAGNKPVRIAFDKNDPAIIEHVLPLSNGFQRTEKLLLGEVWYFPNGITNLNDVDSLVIDTESREVGYYHVPPYMADNSGDLVYQLPRKAYVSVESWVHLFIVDILFGVFAHGKDMEDKAAADWRYRIKILLKAMLEQKQVLDSSEMVSIGRDVIIDPSAVIHGPTTIGNNVTIGPGVVIDNCIIGNNVNISQGCHLMLSVVSDGCFLPFRASLFMTTLMENTMVAQNSCLQLCVIGRDTFIGAGTTFTDFKILPGTITAAIDRQVRDATNLLVLGGCVGHHCRLSSGLVIYPARTVESDVVVLAEKHGQFITQDIHYERSNHHELDVDPPYPRLYPREELPS